MSFSLSPNHHGFGLADVYLHDGHYPLLWPIALPSRVCRYPVPTMQANTVMPLWKALLQESRFLRFLFMTCPLAGFQLNEAAATSAGSKINSPLDLYSAGSRMFSNCFLSGKEKGQSRDSCDESVRIKKKKPLI